MDTDEDINFSRIPIFHDNIDNVVDFGRLVMEQDAKACELNQRGLHATPLKAGVLMPEEYLLERFHNWIREGLNH